MKSLEIVAVMQSPDIGGAEVFMISLLKQFKKKGNKVYVVTNKGKFFRKVIKDLKIKPDKIPIVTDFMGNLRGLFKSTLLLPFTLAYYLNLLFKLKKNKTDLILMSGFSEKLLVSFLSIFFKISVFWIEYGPLEEVFKRNLGIPKFLYKSARHIPKKIIVPTENTKESLLIDAGVSPEKIEKISCGIELIKIKKKQSKLIGNKFIVGSVSRLAKEKGQEYIIKAFPHVLKKIPDALLYVVGDGPAKKYFQNLSDDLGLKEKTVFTGFVRNVYEYYPKFDVFVFPSIWSLEGFGLVMVEAMSQKVPVVGVGIGPVEELINDDKDGIIVSDAYEIGIANAIVRLARDEELRVRIGEEGYKKAVLKYDIQKVSDQYLKTFHENL